MTICIIMGNRIVNKKKLFIALVECENEIFSPNFFFLTLSSSPPFQYQKESSLVSGFHFFIFFFLISYIIIYSLGLDLHMFFNDDTIPHKML